MATLAQPKRCSRYARISNKTAPSNQSFYILPSKIWQLAKYKNKNKGSGSMTGNQSNTLLPEKPLQPAKAKSRHRRRELTALVTASSSERAIRNDLVPKLALIACA